MIEPFVTILAAGGKSNSLGRSAEVLSAVLADKHRLAELYECVHDSDAWIRMRAIDAIEKVCRKQPTWLLPYIDIIQMELTISKQPFVQWHIAQLYGQLPLTAIQQKHAVAWLQRLLSTTEIDWIVAANAMKTLSKFTNNGALPVANMIKLLEIQRQHESKSVVRKADQLLRSFCSV